MRFNASILLLFSVITIIIPLSSCKKKEFVLGLKNSSYSIDSLEVIVKINDSIYVNTILDNDSIDHSYNKYSFPIPQGKNRIEVSFSNAVGNNIVRREFIFPDKDQLNVIYYYHKIIDINTGNDTLIVPPKFEVFWGKLK